MTYRLKTVRFQNRDCKILLQNENGPCPLLAASNALLLKGAVALPPRSVRGGAASLEDVANMLAEHSLHHCRVGDQSHVFHVNELMQCVPRFQYGMDVNPRFTRGCAGYEYTAELTAFDMLQCRLVHGWLLDPATPTAEAVGSKTYNELVEKVIAGKEKEAELTRLQEEIQQLDLLSDTDRIAELKQRELDLQREATEAHLMDHFLSESSHQLTQYGLEVLHEHIQEGELCVFFRNNHFGTLTKKDKHLYLLVTDLGYANTPAIVWEKLDVIDGDTEYVNAQFQTNAGPVYQEGPTLTPEQMMAASSQTERDYQLALHLSKHHHSASAQLDEQEGQIMAAATEASLREYNGLPPVQQQQQAAASGTKVDPSSLPAGVEVGVPLAGSPIPSPAAVSSPPPAAPTMVQLPPAAAASSSPAKSQEEADRMLAMQLQSHEEVVAPAPHPTTVATPSAAVHPDAALAYQLQQEEEQRAIERHARQQRRRVVRQQQQQPVTATASDSKCIIM